MQRVLSVQPGADSFLPPEFSAHYKSLHGSAREDPSKPRNQNIGLQVLTTVVALSMFLSKWRVLTSALSPELYSRPTFAASDPRLPAIQSAVTQADAFLGPCVQNKESEPARLRNLEEIMKRGARLSWLLLSQPAEFAADWSGEGSEVLIVYPGLVQVTNGEGRALAQRRTLGQVKEAVRA